MTFNVNQTQAMLERLKDEELRKYTEMHKADPYVVALALDEANRRKRVRAAGQLQAPQQPKVVDQVVASMAARMPEDSGIAQLPAGDMHFADGGIVAFAGGGAPSGAIVRNPNPTKEELEKARRQTQMYIEGAQAAAAGRPTTVDRAEAPVAKASWEQDLEDLQAQNVDMGDNWLTYSSDRAAMQDRQNAAQAAAKGQDVGSVFTPDPNSGLRQLEQAAAAKGNEQADMTADDAGGGGRGTGIGKQDVMSMYNASLDEARKGRTDNKADVESIGAAREALAAEQLAGLKGINEKFADIYKGRKERLDTRESELGTRKDQYMGLALLQAGAAMMSTPGGLGTAIGKGVDVGAKQYGEGLQRLNDAKEKLFDARDKLDELNANRQEMSAREILKAEGGVKEAAIASKENMLKYIMDTEKVDRETATKLLDAKIRLGVANIQASSYSRPGEAERVMKEADRIRATKGDEAAEAYLQRFERIKGFGKADPGLKDPAYKAAVEEANRMQRMADATTDPDKKQQYQTIADNKRKEAQGYLRSSNQGATGVNSVGAPPPGAVRLKQ